MQKVLYFNVESIRYFFDINVNTTESDRIVNFEGTSFIAPGNRPMESQYYKMAFDIATEDKSKFHTVCTDANSHKFYSTYFEKDVIIANGL